MRIVCWKTSTLWQCHFISYIHEAKSVWGSQLDIHWKAWHSVTTSSHFQHPEGEVGKVGKGFQSDIHWKDPHSVTTSLHFWHREGEAGKVGKGFQFDIHWKDQHSVTTSLHFWHPKGEVGKVRKGFQSDVHWATSTMRQRLCISYIQKAKRVKGSQPVMYWPVFNTVWVWGSKPASALRTSHCLLVWRGNQTERLIHKAEYESKTNTKHCQTHMFVAVHRINPQAAENWKEQRKVPQLPWLSSTTQR